MNEKLKGWRKIQNVDRAGVVSPTALQTLQRSKLGIVKGQTLKM